MRIEELNWMDVERYLESDDRLILILGATEQHGPDSPTRYSKSGRLPRRPDTASHGLCAGRNVGQSGDRHG